MAFLYIVLCLVLMWATYKFLDDEKAWLQWLIYVALGLAIILALLWASGVLTQTSG